MATNICMLVTNPVTHDPRVRREAATLSKAGYHVVVIGVCGEGYSPEEWLDGYRIIRIDPPRLFVQVSLREFICGLLRKIAPGLYAFLRKHYRRLRFGPNADEQILLQQSMTAKTGPLVPATSREKLIEDLRNIVVLTLFNVALVRIAIKQRAALYHAHDLDTLPAGYLAARWTEGKLVYDFHELYSEQFQKGEKTALWKLFHSGLERFLVKRTDLRLTVCDSLGEWVSRRYRVNGVTTVVNVPHYAACGSVRVRENKETLVVYQGLYIRNRGLEQVIESARYLQSGRIVLRGYGELEGRLRALVREKGVEEKVSFAPPVPMTDLVMTASEADIGVAPFLPVCLNTQFCLPNKLFEYMMAGLAIAASDLSELRRVVLEHKLGGIFDPYDPKDIARVLNELIRDEARLEQMKRNSLQAARTVYNWETEAEKLLNVYHSMLQRQASPTESVLQRGAAAR